MSIEHYLIKQIRENLHWLVLNTEVVWEVVNDHPEDSSRWGIRFRNTEKELGTIWEDEV